MQITPNLQFYTHWYDRSLTLDSKDWDLVVGGLVDHPLRLSYPEILTMPSIEVMRTVECIGNPVGGDLIGNATWRGISIRDLLRQAGLRANGKYLVMGSADDYSTTIPIESALHDQALLVHTMNDAPLPPFHGYPLRALIPGVYGQKQPKWLYTLEVTEDYKKGTWENKGWSDTAIIQPNSRIDRPTSGSVITGKPGNVFTITGVAFTSLAGVARVEVSTDNGATWHAATLTRAPAPFTDLVWTPWGFDWRLPPSGRYTLLARVTDNAGNSQGESTFHMFGGTFPNGTSDIQAVVVDVETG
jgi:DMSO/TMAO reductase YedYZ molybdopterin-dependent catalytic subunit